MRYKYCPSCECILPEICFYKHKNRPDGLKGECSDCEKLRAKLMYPFKKEKILLCNKKWRESHKPQRNKYFKEYRLENLEYVSKRESNYRKKNRKDINETRRKWMKTPKGREHLRKVNAKRRKLKYIPLMDNPFPEDIKIRWHHINNIFVIPIPKTTHEYCSTPLREKHIEKCNSIIENLFNLNLKFLYSAFINL